MKKGKRPDIAFETRNRMMKKIEKGKAFIEDHLDTFQCPVCASPFNTLEGYQLTCLKHHQFDLSKKGTLHFLLKPVQSEYTRDMLLSRQRIAQSGFWHPLLDTIYERIVKPDGFHLDVGSGEGYHSHYLKTAGLSGPIIAFDISKEGVNLGAATYDDLFFMVADLAQSPFAPDSFDTILNILSPSNYQEFKRILKPGGQVIKVVPGKDYLKELRQLVKSEDKDYSNERVVRKFAEHYPNYQEIPVRYSVSLDDSQIEDFVNMTPLGWHLKEDAYIKHMLQTITVDLILLEGVSD